MTRDGKPIESYQMQMVNDPLLSPLLVQMAVFSAIDATERTVGASTLRVTGEIEFQNAPAPIQINNMFSGDNGSATQASLSTAIPVAYVMQSGFDSLKLKKIALNIEAFDQKKQLTIDGVTASQREAHAGDNHPAQRLAGGENGAETSRQMDYKVPIGAEPGPLYLHRRRRQHRQPVTDFRQILGARPRSPPAS